MYSAARQGYLELEVLGSDRVGLVKLLYRGALEAVTQATLHFNDRDVLARGRAISKAQSLIGELSISLDRSKGGDISRNLARLYEYMMGRLSAGHIEQRIEPLIEVRRLLATLGEAWEIVEDEPQPAAPDEREPEPFLYYDSEPELEHNGISLAG